MQYFMDSLEYYYSRIQNYKGGYADESEIYVLIAYIFILHDAQRVHEEVYVGIAQI